MANSFSENGVIIPENIMKNQNVDLESVAIACARMAEDKVLFQVESPFHSIAVCENSIGRFLRYGISFQAGRIDSPIYQGNIPYLNYFLLSYLLKKNAKKILLIGFGTGILVKQFEKIFKNLKQFDVVDIEENILPIAKKYFDFTESEKFHFHLQDALVYLRNNKTKYDLIITDVAGNEGIDERFFEDEFFNNIKKSLKKDGVFAFNSCANTDFNENEETFFGFTVKKYKEHFKNFAVFNGMTSDLTYFKAFFDIDKRVLDVTNAIIFSSDKEFDKQVFDKINDEDLKTISAINVDILPYSKDLHKIYKA